MTNWKLWCQVVILNGGGDVWREIGRKRANDEVNLNCSRERVPREGITKSDTTPGHCRATARDDATVIHVWEGIIQKRAQHHRVLFSFLHLFLFFLYPLHHWPAVGTSRPALIIAGRRLGTVRLLTASTRIIIAIPIPIHPAIV
jgi:hypothetical protein